MNLSALYTADPAEQPLERLVTDGGYCGILRRVAVIGDSLSSGEFEALTPEGEKTYHDYFDYSWGQYLARMAGITVLNFSRGGMTAKEYCNSYAESQGWWDPSLRCQGYILALGVNDLYGQNQPLGSLEDIDFENPKRNKPTFAGYYARILQRYKQIQPEGKFFLMTMPVEDEHREQGDAHAALLYELAEAFPNTYVLDLRRYGPVYDAEFKKLFFRGGHMTPAGYLLTARLVASYLDYLIRHHMDAFSQTGFIGTEHRYPEE